MSSETETLSQEDRLMDEGNLDEKILNEENSDEQDSDGESSYESDSDYETDSEEEEEAIADEEGDDDGMELLMQARRRMQEQKEKESEVEEHDSDESEYDEESEEESDDDEDLESEVEEGVEHLDLNEKIGDSSQRSLHSESPIQAQWVSPSKGIDKAKSTAGLLPEAENDASNMTALRRRQRDENAELWELLRHSQNRVAETKDLVDKVEKAEQTESGEDSDGELDVKENTESTPAARDSLEVTDSDAKENSPKFQMEDEKKSEDEVERDFEEENRELFELLQQSKLRLEEAARKKEEEAEKEAAADERIDVKENPYMDLDNLPDAPEDKTDDEDLTQKELLIAMAVAEEAARSGTGNFVTPPKEVLRSRDLASFEFLKEEEENACTSPSEAQTSEDITVEEEKK
mmetsp:Transcript_17555/g.26599  ORF Transcript_17555/g.26599 Transcript_17555/m.26599 type:complete len:406 (-) Transcript_17555:10-1227(-)